MRSILLDRCLIAVTFGVFFAASGLSFAAESGGAGLREEETSRARTVWTGVGYQRILLDDEVLSSPFVEAGTMTSLGRRLSAGASFGQAFATDKGMSATAFSYGADLVWSPLGPMTGLVRSIGTDGFDVFNSESEAASGLRLSGGLRQYYFHTAERSLPFSGFSLGTAWEQRVSGEASVAVGVETLSLSNGKFDLRPLRAFARLMWTP